MNPRLPYATLALAIAIAPMAAGAQPANPVRVGFLRAGTPPQQYLREFRSGMKAHGHVEGKTFVIIPGWDNQRKTSLSVLATRLVSRGVDIVVTEGSRAARTANGAAPKTPIVMASSSDPVRAGLVRSLASPGGTITGLMSSTVDLVPKSFEILKEMIPNLKRIATFYRNNSESRVRELFEAAEQRSGRVLDIETENLIPKKGEDFLSTFARAADAQVGAVYVRATPNLSRQEQIRLVEAANMARLPTMYATKQLVQLGGLISYGTNRAKMYRRAATFVDKIIKGAKPADLPIERPPKMDMVINLKTARMLGIKVPSSILLRADEVIE